MSTRDDRSTHAAADSAEAGASRRHFLIGLGVIAAGTASGLLVAPRLFGTAHAAVPAGAGSVPADFKAHAFLRIAPDDTITVTIGKSEMGQGIYTGLPMMLAEELDVDPRRLKIEFAGIDPAFNHPFLPQQFTGGSSSTVTLFTPMRQVGAAARSMLVGAAARQWNVDAATLRTQDGVVTSADGTKRASYGALAAGAASMTLPKLDSVVLKDPKDFKYIGKGAKRLDGTAKVTGRAVFGLDVDLPDMLVAMVARAPVFGAKVRSFDPTAARAVKGVVDVKQVPSGIAVLAEHTWAARKGREALVVEWDLGPGADVSTASLRKDFRAKLKEKGLTALNVGDVDAALAKAAKQIDVEYETPYLAHACMEPLNAVALVKDGKCEIWSGTQMQSQDAGFIAAALGIKPADVKINTTFLGGGFGRRASSTGDFTVEAAQVANGVGRPVKVVWTREDDMRGGYYRPFTVSRFRGGIDDKGVPVALHHVHVGKPVLASAPIGKFVVKNGIDPTSGEGSADMPYAIANHRVEVHNTTEIVPILWWRSVGHSVNGFVVNSVIDELAVLGKRDPLEVRRGMLADKPRHLAVLNKAAAEAGWGKALAAGHHHGIALEESFGTIVAQVAEVSVTKGKVQVHRVTCAVDCGIAVNPDQIQAQIQSAVNFGLSAALHGQITLDKGRVQQANFDSYPVLRLDAAPRIDVFIVDSGGPIGGMGEPGLPPIAGAVCNAIYAATGKRIRSLPIRI
jgi:isoquinoline 1-oxidoreductase beta subunit